MESRDMRIDEVRKKIFTLLSSGFGIEEPAFSD